MIQPPTFLLKFDNINEITNKLDEISVSSSFSCSAQDCKNLMPPPTDCLSILTQNIRSIGCNFPGFLALIEQIGINCDILVLTECWLSCCPNIPLIDNYEYYSNKIFSNQNEGVVVYIKKNLKASIVEPSFNQGNCIILKLQDTVVVAVYRSPSYKNTDGFLNSINNVLTSLTSYKNIILIGDINIDILSEDSSTYLNLMASHGLLPSHNLVTRDASGTCLDHVFLKTTTSAITLVPQTTLTDHKSVLFFLNYKLNRVNMSRTQTIVDYNKIKTDLELLNLQPIYNCLNPNQSLNFFVNAIQTIVDNNTTVIKYPCRKQTIKPWITPGLLKCIQNRDKLHAKCKKDSDNIIIVTSYRRYRNFCNLLLKKIKTQYEKSQLEKAGNNNKKIWEILKSVTSTVKVKNTSQDLLSNAPTPEQAVNNVNVYFSNVGKNLAQKINNYNLSKPISKTKSLHSFCLLETDQEELESLISSLKTDCSVGIDKISSKILKQNKDILIKPLLHIFNQCLELACFPTILKTSIIIPIHKGGDRDRVENYRPISILPSISKLLEKLINNRLTKYLEHNKILSDNQFGFRGGKSTEDAVLKLTNYISSNLDKGKKCLSVFLDLAKAFDTVSVPILLQKLDDIGVRGIQLQLFQDYLNNRTQHVKIGSHLSSEQPAGQGYGVPQGSILGPTLFLIYINDLCALTTLRGTIVSYADDTALLFSADNWDEVFRTAQEGLNLVTNWLQENYLTLNAEKTKFLTFSIRSNTQPDHTFSLTAHSCHSNSSSNDCKCVSLQKTETIKYLGVLIDQHLNFKPHINLLTSRVRKLIYVFKNLRHIAQPHILKRVYFSLCQSLISYCITSWGGAPKTNLLPLEIAQRAVLKVCTFRNFLYPTHLLYEHCQVLSVRQLFILQSMLKQHSSVHQLIQKPPKRRQFKIYQQNTIFKTVFAKRFFPFTGPFIYNKLNKILMINNLIKHKAKFVITNYLLNLSYSETESILEIVQ